MKPRTPLRLVSGIALTLIVLLSTPAGAFAREPDDSRKRAGTAGPSFVPAIKFTAVDGRLATLAGAAVHWPVGARWTVGLGGYGLTHDLDRLELGYGGLWLSRRFALSGSTWLSVGGLVGGGSAGRVPAVANHAVLIVEPEVRVRTRLTGRAGLDLAAGYRFAGAAIGSPSLGGFAGTMGLSIAIR